MGGALHLIGNATNRASGTQRRRSHDERFPQQQLSSCFIGIQLGKKFLKRDNDTHHGLPHDFSESPP